MPSDSESAHNDAAARAASLSARAKDLQRAQAEVMDATVRQLRTLAQSAAVFFDRLPLMEFTPVLFPQNAWAIRRLRHRVLHRTVREDSSGMAIRALLLGRDGAMRMFIAQSAHADDLVAAMEPGVAIPLSVKRSVEAWTPTLRAAEFQPFDMLDKLWQTLDDVERQIAAAEQRVSAQRAALESGDRSALKAPPVTNQAATFQADTRNIVERIAVTSSEPRRAQSSRIVPIPEPNDPFDWDALAQVSTPTDANAAHAASNRTTE
jgi:hypothetical protein